MVEMGMYDIIFVEMTCPKCGMFINSDCQTKQGLKTLSSYHIGDTFPLNEEHRQLEEQNYRLRNRNIDPGEPAFNKYVIWLLGGCPNCRCMLKGCAYIDRMTNIIEEVSIYRYSVDIEPEIVVRRKQDGKM